MTNSRFFFLISYLGQSHSALCRFTSFLIIFLTLFNTPVFADDPGITKVRLIQLEEKSYLMEVDISQVLLYTIKPPILPERFQVSEMVFENNSGWIVISIEISTEGTPLNAKDEILFPWLRNGVDITTFWLDDTQFKGLFNRGLDGIRVPMNQVMPSDKSTLEVLEQGVQFGFKQAAFKGIPILFAFCLLLLFGRKKTRYFAFFLLGQGVALIFLEVGVPGFDLLFAQLLLLISSLIMAFYSFKQEELGSIRYIMLILGIALGLSYGNEINVLGLPMLQKVQSLFGFILAFNGLLLIVLLISILLMERIKDTNAEIAFRYGAGGISVFLLLLVMQQNVLIGEKDILSLNSGSSRLPSLYTTTSSQPGNQLQRGSGSMTTPIMSFLSIESYEIRNEILVELSEGLLMLNKSAVEDVVPIQDQESILKAIADSIAVHSKISIDGSLRSPNEINVNFVSMSMAGVSIRESPRDEFVDSGIVGVTLIFDIAEEPENVTQYWTYYSESASLIEASVIDENSYATQIFSLAETQLDWEKRFASRRGDVVQQIEVEKQPIPWISIVLLIIVIVLIILSVTKKSPLNRKLVYSLSITALLVYPFIRFDTQLSRVPAWVPSREVSSEILKDVLTNVYRAFDRRNENEVYDRLSLTVTGDQLSDIYLQNRAALSLENRGGARAKVDKVEILNIENVTNTGDFLEVDGSWLVSGSVNHFGHTHYRKNQYRALVRLEIIDNHWKISEIETIEEKRIL